MTQYILFIQNNCKSEPTADEWDAFIAAARQSGAFKGGSEIAKRVLVGDTNSAKSTDHIVGYMRFDADGEQQILDLLQKHPVVLRGGTVELCEMPKS